MSLGTWTYIHLFLACRMYYSTVIAMKISGKWIGGGWWTWTWTFLIFHADVKNFYTCTFLLSLLLEISKIWSMMNRFTDWWIPWNVCMYTQSLFQWAEFSLSDSEDLKAVNGHAETLSIPFCSAVVLYDCLHLQMTHYNMYQFFLCSCSCKKLKELLHVLIYSTELRWWNTCWTAVFSVQYLCEKKLYKSCKSRYLGVWLPSTSVIFKLVKKVHSTWSFLDKKYTGQSTVLI
jgi:hypothetical protein